MDKLNIMKVLTEVTCDLKASGYNVFAVVLQGSQNYNLDIYEPEYSSDIDCKAFVLPSFDDVYTGDKVSKVVKTSHGQVEIKDIRLLEELLAKANPSYLELLASNFFVVSNEEAWLKIKGLLSGLVIDRKTLLLKSIYGMALEKEKALMHPYPATLDKIEKFGYDPKQLHHIVRLRMMMDELLSGTGDFGVALWHEDTDNRRRLLDLKLGKEPLEEATYIASHEVSYMKALKEGTELLYPITSDSLYVLKGIVKSVVKEYLKNSLQNE